MNDDLLVLNLYGGPGTGKSTTAALVFGELKQRGINAELVTEYAKDLVWEGRSTLRCQPYVFGKQLWRQERLRDKVDVAVTDSPIFLSAIYGEALGDDWISVVLQQMYSFSNINIYLERDNDVHPYQSAGRYQADVHEAKALDERIHQVLSDEDVEHDHISIGDTNYIETMLKFVLERLG